jgi:hypothetical protein
VPKAISLSAIVVAVISGFIVMLIGALLVFQGMWWASFMTHVARRVLCRFFKKVEMRNFHLILFVSRQKEGLSFKAFVLLLQVKPLVLETRPLCLDLNLAILFMLFLIPLQKLLLLEPQVLSVKSDQ